MILARCTDTVLTLRFRTMAISLFDLPCTINCRTSSSRVESLGRRFRRVRQLAEPRVQHLLARRDLATADTSSRSIAFFSR